MSINLSPGDPSNGSPQPQSDNILPMPRTLQPRDWTVLLKRIREGRCTPFLGAGASFGSLPLGATLAQQWAKDFGYPLEDTYDLIRVSQFVAVDQEDGMYPKEELAEQFKSVKLPDFNVPNDPHGFLADLPLPVYITTNYDNFMFKALESRGKHPQREICRWNSQLYGLPSVWDRVDYVPTDRTPLVFHLHGRAEIPASLVLTEDDYLDFLTAMSKKENKLLPPRIQEAMANTSLLFIGYRIADWNFHVLFRSLVTSLETGQIRKHVSVQVLPNTNGADRERQEKILNYLDKYYHKLNTRVYWGKGHEFMAELKARWEEDGSD